ncbi:hypothetical protein RHMOL_Rhmol07G0218200 [Rhododendron molle]|nr:hypothetical protein RHMOL_Rhmol07G0218200 [Rhododendron molle]
MNLQTSITVIQQRAIQSDANITRLNDLINTRLPPPFEEEGKDDKDDHPNGASPYRLIAFVCFPLHKPGS